jgi:ABC-type nitrate/sulfonate/bicarbonate transport system ATPase subunit
MKKTPIITLKNVSLSFKLPFRTNTLEVLKKISLDVYDGEFLVMLGPSGSGKSTLLRVLSGLERGYTGTCTLAPSISALDMSFVFQQYALYPWLNVFDNIALGLLARDEKPEMIRTKVQAAAKELGLEKFIDSYPRELSGGMKQRVGIARALVTNPKIIFMDEPFSGLDSFTVTGLRQDLLRIWKEKGMTIVLVTHLASEAVELADRVVVVTPRPCRIDTIMNNDLKRPRKNRTKPFYALEDTIVKLVHS